MSRRRHQSNLGGEAVLLNYFSDIDENTKVSETRLMSDMFDLATRLSKKNLLVEFKWSKNPFLERWSRQISSLLNNYGNAKVVKIVHISKSRKKSGYYFYKGKYIEDVVPIVNKRYPLYAIRILKSEIEAVKKH